MKHAESVAKQSSESVHAAPQLARSWIVRLICICLACLCLVLGTVGLILPGLPAFDFYFLAVLFAAKGSKRLHSWIVQHKVIAPVLKQWGDSRTLPVKLKIFSLISMSIGAVLLILTVPHPWAVGGIVLIMLAVQLWLWFKA